MSADASSFQGIIMIPMMPVMRPPVLKLMYFGERFAKSLAGLTTFAAMFTDTVAMPMPIRERMDVKNRIDGLYIKGKF